MSIVRTNRFYLFILMASVLCAIEIAIVNSAVLTADPQIASLAITVDITAGIPLLFYLLVAHKYRLSPIILAFVFAAAVILASYILPPQNQAYLDYAKSLIPLLEILILTYFVVQVYQRSRQAELHWLDALEISLGKVLNNSLVTTWVVTELSVWYYSMAGWFVRWRKPQPRVIPFFYHRKTLYPLLFAALMHVALIEMVALHLIIQHWNVTLAWIITALNVYTLIWVSADFNAIRLNPILLSTDDLYLRIGIRWRLRTALANIAEMRKLNESDREANDYLNLALIGDARLVLCLQAPVIATGLLGRKKLVSRIGLTLDDENHFTEEVRKALVAPKSLRRFNLNEEIQT